MNNPVHARKLLALTIASASLAMSGCTSDDDDAPQVLLSGGNAGNQVINDYEDWNSVGGAGGWLSLFKETGNGAIRVVRSGRVNAKFDRASVEEEINADLGATPLVITGARTIGVAEAEPETGTPYFGPGGRIHVSDGNGTPYDEAPVTGLRINSGATLTLVPYENWNGDEPLEMARVFVPVLDNRGTVRVQASADDSETGSLAIYADTVLSTGVIDLRGADNAVAQYRRDGGALHVQADAVFIDGRVLVSGGAATGEEDGGRGGSVYIMSEGGQHHRGVFELNGGNSPADDAGHGGFLSLTSQGPLYNEARISANGGNGGEAGGSGGGIFLAAYGGEAWNAGSISANGGSGGEDWGGDGGRLDIYAYGGELRNSGTVTMRGGAGGSLPYFDEDYLDGIIGGEGGVIFARSQPGYGGGIGPRLAARDIGEPVPAANVAWSGGIDLRGGNARAGSALWGGEGGYARIGASNWGFNGPLALDELATTVTLYGYGKLASNGGTGHRGGDGGGFAAVNTTFDYFYDDEDIYHSVLGGGIEAVLNVVANGGNALAGGIDGVGFGGEGGGVYVATEESGSSLYGEDFVRSVSYTGAVAAAGGSSLKLPARGYGSEAGRVTVRGHGAVTVTGVVNASGGRDADAAGYGGDGGGVIVESYLDDVLARVALAGNGGNGAFRGGRGGVLLAAGANVAHEGAVSVKGGDANPALAESAGGAGGSILVLGEVSSTHTGKVNYAAGIGSLPASIGCFIVGDDVQGVCN